MDGVTGVRSSENATCHLTVLPMNNPPLAANDFYAAAAGVITTIHLNVTDVDNNETFHELYITRYIFF